MAEERSTTIKKTRVVDEPAAKAGFFGELLFVFLDQSVYWGVLKIVDARDALQKYTKEHEFVSLMFVLLAASLFINFTIARTAAQATASPLMAACLNGTITADMSLIYESLDDLHSKLNRMNRNIDAFEIPFVLLFFMVSVIFLYVCVSFIRLIKNIKPTS